MKYLYSLIRSVPRPKCFVGVAMLGLSFAAIFNRVSAQTSAHGAISSCPVSLTVQVINLAPEFLLATEDSNPVAAHASSVFQGGLYVELTSLTKPIGEATLAVTVSSHGPQSDMKTTTYHLAAGPLAKSTLIRTLPPALPESRPAASLMAMVAVGCPAKVRPAYSMTSTRSSRPAIPVSTQYFCLRRT